LLRKVIRGTVDLIAVFKIADGKLVLRDQAHRDIALVIGIPEVDLVSIFGYFGVLWVIEVPLSILAGSVPAFMYGNKFFFFFNLLILIFLLFMVFRGKVILCAVKVVPLVISTLGSFLSLIEVDPDSVVLVSKIDYSVRGW